MSDYIHQSDIQVALAALVAIQESFQQISRVITDISEQRRRINYLRQLLDSNSSEANQTGVDKTRENQSMVGQLCSRQSWLFRATTERSRRTIQRMRALLVLLYGSASQRHLATWHAYYIKFHTLLRHRVHADFHPKTLV